MREVKLVMRRASFFLRLRIQFRAMLPTFAVLLAASLLLPAMFVFLLVLTENDELFGLGHAQLFEVAATVNAELFVALGLLITLFRSMGPSRAECFLPRAVTFRVDGLWVEPREGEPYEVSWTWISSAIKTTHGIDLRIGHTPTLILHVTPAMTSESDFEQLSIWLERHRKFS